MSTSTQGAPQRDKGSAFWGWVILGICVTVFGVCGACAGATVMAIVDGVRP